MFYFQFLIENYTDTYILHLPPHFAMHYYVAFTSMWACVWLTIVHPLEISFVCFWTILKKTHGHNVFYQFCYLFIFLCLFYFEISLISYIFQA